MFNIYTRNFLSAILVLQLYYFQFDKTSKYEEEKIEIPKQTTAK